MIDSLKLYSPASCLVIAAIGFIFGLPRTNATIAVIFLILAATVVVSETEAKRQRHALARRLDARPTRPGA